MVQKKQDNTQRIAAGYAPKPENQKMKDLLNQELDKSYSIRAKKYQRPKLYEDNNN